MSASGWRVCAGAAAAVFVALLACGKQNPSTGSGTTTEPRGVRTVEINLKFANRSYVAGEDIGMTVTVTNRTPGQIEIPDPFHRDNWQPTYTLTGPSYPKGHTFSFRSVALPDTPPEPEGVDAVLVKLGPGQSLEEEIPLRSWAPMSEAGEYEIVAQLKWQGVAAQSAPARFRLEKSQVGAASVGVDAEAAGTPGEWVEWFHKDPAGQKLYTALFKRPHSDVHGYEGFGVQAIFTAGAQAADLLSPWTNYNRMAELAKWRVWREGSALVGLITSSTTPQRLELGAVPESIVRPALMSRTGELDVFFVTAGKPELGLARFPTPKWEGAQTPARVIWRLPIPAKPIAARCAIAPESAASQRRVLVVAQEQGSVAVHFMNAGDGSGAGHWETARIPNSVAMPGAEPALRVSEDGMSHAAILLEMDPGARRFAIADLVFGRDGKLSGDVLVKPLGQLEASPKAAAAAYVVTQGSAMRRDWVVLLENGKFVHSGSEGEARQFSGTPVLPLQLIPLAAGTYLLTLDENGKPGFTLLD
jgi:hypothetical protein